jgi:hypothetical protein
MLLLSSDLKCADRSDFGLLGCDTTQISKRIHAFRRNVVPPSSGLRWIFVTTRCHKTDNHSADHQFLA